jgi:hypothetical protein
MKVQKLLVGMAVLALALALSLGPGVAQGPEEPAQPQGTLDVEAVVSSKFTYQGMLRQDGTPVTGRRDMVFRLYSDDACSTQITGSISVPGVEVNEGLFSVELPVQQGAFVGRALWLAIQVGDTRVGCQEILPVPYALSLRPGATIMAERTGADVIHILNSATGGRSYGVAGLSNSSSGAGVLARGTEPGADLILGGESNNEDNGMIKSDPAYASSDIILVTNDTVRIDLNDDGDSDDGDFEIYDKDDQLIFDVDDSGSVLFGGPGLAAFPRPAYDSGWRAILQNRCLTLNHNLGRNRDNYVIDLQFKKEGRVHQLGYGGRADSDGGFWHSLTTTSIMACRGYSDSLLDSLRVRIWVYP